MKVLIAVDGSDQGNAVLAYGLSLAQRLHADIDVIHVVEDPPVSFWGMMAGLEPHAVRVQLEVRAADVVGHAQRLAQERSVELRARALRGSPARVLLNEAAAYDLLVMGSHGHKGLERTLLGSVAETLVRESPTPVLVVRPPFGAVPPRAANLLERHAAPSAPASGGPPSPPSP